MHQNSKSFVLARKKNYLDRAFFTIPIKILPKMTNQQHTLKIDRTMVQSSSFLIKLVIKIVQVCD